MNFLEKNKNIVKIILLVIILLFFVLCLCIAIKIIKGVSEREYRNRGREESESEYVTEVGDDSLYKQASDYIDSIKMGYTETEEMIFESEEDDEKPSWISENVVSTCDKVDLIYNKNQEDSYELVEQIDERLKKPIEHIKQVNEGIFQNTHYPDYSVLYKYMDSLSYDNRNSFISSNTFDVEAGFKDKDSLHFFTDFKDHYWFNLYDCLCAIYFFDDTKVVLIPINIYTNEFTNLHEIIVKDFKDCYLGRNLNSRSLMLGDIISIPHGLVKGAYLESYEKYKILYANKNSVYVGDNTNFSE